MPLFREIFNHVTFTPTMDGNPDLVEPDDTLQDLPNATTVPVLGMLSIAFIIGGLIGIESSGPGNSI